MEVNLSSREPGFHKKRFQSHHDTQDTNTFKFFHVSIRNSKCVENFKFHNDAPMLKYCQKSLNSCFSSSLASAFACIEQAKAANVIALKME